MRRKDREIQKIDDVFRVIENCSVVHLAMVDGAKPYAVALNFGYDRQGDDLILYLHSAAEGRKIDVLKKNPDVYFQMDCSHALVPGTVEEPCRYSFLFDSVTGSGRAEFLSEASEKSYALNRILQHLDKTDAQFTFPAQMLENTCVLRIVSHDVVGKRHE